MEVNNIQALPDFGKQSQGLPIEVLQVLQLATSEISPVSIPDPVDSLARNEIIAPLRSELLLLICCSNNHLSGKNLQPVQASTDSCQKLHLPSLQTGQWDRQGLLLLNNCVYLPSVSQARLHILQSRHDSSLAGHPGITKTLGLITCNYIWPGLRKDVDPH